MRQLVLILAAAMLAAVLSACSEKSQAASEPGIVPPPAKVANVTYAAHIKPIFEQSCFKCHGADKQKGGLRVDSLEALVKGGDDGPVFEIGKSDTSMLVTNIARVGDEDDWMPPIDKGKPLTQEQVALVRAWIDQGAK